MKPPFIPRRRFMRANLFLLFSLHTIMRPVLAQVSADVGGTSLVLAGPGKFVAIKSGDQFFDMMRTLIPPANELLAVFVGEKDLQSLRRGDGKAPPTYFLVQTPKQWIEKRFSQGDFDGFKKHVREKQAAQIASTGRPTQAQLDAMLKELRARGADMAASVGQPVSLGVYFETDAAIGTTILENATVSSEGKSTQIHKVGTYVIAFVKGKVLFLYLYRDYTGMPDVHWVQEEAKKWAEEIRRRNV